VLVVSTTVWMVDGVHGNTTCTRPVVSLRFVLVVSTTCLEERLVDPTATSDDAHRYPCSARDGLLGATGETYATLVVVGRVTNDGSVVAGCTGECATVAGFLLDVADDGTLRALADGKDITWCQGSLFAAIDEGAGVETFGCDEGFCAGFVPIGIAEDDTGERCTAAWVMDDFFYESSNIAVAFCKVQCAQPSWCFVVMGVSFEYGMRTPLCPNDPTHYRRLS